MAYVAVDEGGREAFFNLPPSRVYNDDEGFWAGGRVYVDVPKGSIEKLIGRKLTWDDEPVELTNDIS